MDGINTGIMDHIEEMQKKMTMMQEQMRRNMEMMMKSKMVNESANVDSNSPNIPYIALSRFCYLTYDILWYVALPMPYGEIKMEIENKTKALLDPNLSEKEKEKINIDLERVRNSLWDFF